MQQLKRAKTVREGPLTDLQLARDGDKKRQAGTLPSDFAYTMFKTGRISAPETQELAESVTTVASSSSDVRSTEYAAAGGPRRLTGNMSRDLLRSMGKRSKLPPVYQARIPFWDAVRSEKYMDVCNFLLPHELLFYVAESLGLEQLLHIRNNVHLENTFNTWKLANGLADVLSVLALGLWGDSATFFTRDSLYVMLLNIISGEHHTRYMIVSFGKNMCCNCGCYGRCTFEAVWKIVVWSCRQAHLGIFP